MATPPPNKTQAKRQAPPTKKPVSSQRYLDVAQVRDGVVVLRDGSLRAVILVNAINFALKSEEEQNALVYAYQGFLNSFNFPIQIVMQSRQLDLTNYLKKLQDRLAETTNELVQVQITDYTEFIERLIQIANIMDKKFYVVVPFQPPAVLQRGVFDKLLHPGNRLEVRMSPAEFKSYRQELLERTRIIMGGLASIGLRTALLGTQETIELLYTTYNPEEATKERLTNVESITGAYVHPNKGTEQKTPAAPNPAPASTNPMAEIRPEPEQQAATATTSSETPSAPVAAPTEIRESGIANQESQAPVSAPAPAAAPSTPNPVEPTNTPVPAAIEPNPSEPSTKPQAPEPAPAANPPAEQKPLVAPTDALTALPGSLPATAGPAEATPPKQEAQLRQGSAGQAASMDQGNTPATPIQPAQPATAANQTAANPTPGIGQPTNAAAPTPPVPPATV